MKFSEFVMNVTNVVFYGRKPENETGICVSGSAPGRMDKYKPFGLEFFQLLAVSLITGLLCVLFEVLVDWSWLFLFLCLETFFISVRCNLREDWNQPVSIKVADSKKLAKDSFKLLLINIALWGLGMVIFLPLDWLVMDEGEDFMQDVYAMLALCSFVCVPFLYAVFCNFICYFVEEVYEKNSNR